MKLTKYQHACFTLEKDGKLLVVDPGVWTTDLPALENVVAIVVTHIHPDHFDMTALEAIIAHSPNAIIYAHEDITKQLGDVFTYKTANAGDKMEAAPFTLEFFGGQHAPIHHTYPLAANLGVLINESLYYPGDSFAHPQKSVETLALPVTAPWLKISEVMDFCDAVKAPIVFPTHDAVASNTGKALVDRMLTPIVETYGGKYQRPSETIEIDG